MTKEEKLIDTIVDLADERLGGKRSRTAGPLFYDIAAASETRVPKTRTHHAAGSLPLSL